MNTRMLLLSVLIIDVSKIFMLKLSIFFIGRRSMWSVGCHGV